MYSFLGRILRCPSWSKYCPDLWGQRAQFCRSRLIQEKCPSPPQKPVLTASLFTYAFLSMACSFSWILTAAHSLFTLASHPICCFNETAPPLQRAARWLPNICTYIPHLTPDSLRSQLPYERINPVKARGLARDKYLEGHNPKTSRDINR